MKMHAIMVSIFAALLLCLNPPVEAGGPAAAGKIVIARGVDVTSLDPHKAISSVDLNYCTTVFDALLRRTGSDEISPNLAESYRNINPTTWEFTIRKGVFFHNGDPLTAADVVFSLNRAMNSKSPLITFLGDLKNIVAVDHRTVRVVTARPDPILPNRMAFAAYIVPEKYIREKGDAYFAQHPVGTGRYRFVGRTAGDLVKLEANSRYWGAKPATVKTLVFRSIPDPVKRVEALTGGEVDLAAGVPPHLTQSLRDDPGVKVITGHSGRLIFVGMNLSGPGGGPLSDRRVRQAIAHAVDRQALAGGALMGAGEPLATPLVRHVFGHDPSIRAYPYDPERAKKLLAEAGWPEGFETVMATPSGRYIRDREVASAVADMLGKVGIRVRVKVYEWAEYMRMLRTRQLEPLYLLGWGNTIFDADGILVPLFSSGSAISHYSNPKLDRLLKAARFETDRDKRKALYRESLLLIHEDVPAIFLYEQVESYGVSKKVVFSPLHGSERKDSDKLELEEIDTTDDTLKLKN